MAGKEADVITHLLEVESQASALIDDAQTESSRRILSAKQKADESFQAKYRELVEVLENDYSQKIKSLDENHRKAFEIYQETIRNSNKDVDAFNSMLDKILLKA